MRDLENKVVVITGASSGFGKGAALAYAERGASLVLCARRADLIADLARECQEKNVRALPVPCDVAVKEEVERVAAETVKHFNRIDVWINNAGAAVIGPFNLAPLEDHVKVIETNLTGTIYGSYFAMQQFIAQGTGTLINVASMIGKVPAPYYASYTAAKHGVVGLSAALRQELSQGGLDRIKVCTVMPAAMDTYFFGHAANYSGHKGVPIPPLDDAQKVIDVLVDLATHPKDEVPVGNLSGTFTFADSVLQGMTEAMMAMNTHKVQIEDAPEAPPTAGNLRQTSAYGTTVHDPALRK